MRSRLPTLDSHFADAVHSAIDDSHIADAPEQAARAVDDGADDSGIVQLVDEVLVVEHGIDAFEGMRPMLSGRRGSTM